VTPPTVCRDDDVAGGSGIIARVRTLDSRVVYRNRWMSVREDRVERSDGAPGVYGVVDKPDFALIVPRERDGLWMVEQYRYPVRRRAWEFPQGSWAARSGSPLDLARAELAEETGLRARRLRPLGHLYAAYGFCSQGFDVFLATGLEPGEPVREASERDMVHRFVADDEFARMFERAEIVDAATIAAYALLRLS
jgi:8-oxo-dGTP pyrophosphatase MutT (NUDIX family)